MHHNMNFRVEKTEINKIKILSFNSKMLFKAIKTLLITSFEMISIIVTRADDPMHQENYCTDDGM